MTLKRWMLGKVNDASDRRGDERVPPSLAADADAEDAREPNLREGRPHAEREAAHLGRYAPLVGAIRDELEQFVASELRLHLAIAERDRYVLTSIEVECDESAERRDLLRRFMREFKPEQIKQYLAREVIAGLRNASAIDLTQFAGLNAGQPEEQAPDDEGYEALLAQLESQAPAPSPPYRVTLVGRWAEQSPASRAGEAATGPRTRGESMPHTPLAGRTIALDVADGEGERRVELASIVPGRRYSIGKDENCDVVVSGLYASRRHCEIWFDAGTWWVADAGSTNGFRVEHHGTTRHATPGTRAQPIALAEGAVLVLSAHGEGAAAQYPRIVLATPAEEGVDAPRTEPATLVTPIAPPRRAPAGWSITAEMASGTRGAEIAAPALPFRIGRSRNQALVIDWTHADVSGRHVEIVALDDDGASVVVHGENGVVVEGTRYAAGAQFRWKPGERMLLGHTDAATPRCSLTLAHVSG